MARVRFTVLFHHQSSETSFPSAPPVRVAGWSESFYYDDTIVNAFVLRQFMLRRAALLPTGAFIVGQRYQFADGSSRSDSVRIDSSTGLSVDVPQMALLCTARNLDFQSTRRFMIRGLPDDWVVAGELATGAVGQIIQSRLDLYFNVLNVMQWKARNRSAASADIATVATDGTFVLNQDLVFNVGDRLRMVRVKDIYGRSVTGTFQVTTATDTRTGKLTGWPAGVTVTGIGRMQFVSFVYPPFIGPGGTQVSQISVSRVVVKKVGRSFFQYRGRQPKRKKL